MWRDLFGNFFLTFRFREVLADSFENAALESLGIKLPGDFDFFWQQQSFDDPKLIAPRLLYNERSRSFFKRKLESSLVLLNRVAKSSERRGMKLIFLYSDGVCKEFRKKLAPRAIAAEQSLADRLKKIANKYDTVYFEQLTPFACDEYAELFHLNSAGRRKFFEKVSIVLDSHLGNTR
jgi:hypothetical protein